jgi:UDP-glucose 4-epimerase
MRVVVMGATGNVGTSLLERLVDDPRVATVLGVARRRPALALPNVEWHEADVAVDDLGPLVEGADAVVHLAWQIQPSRRLRSVYDTNVVGSLRVFDAVRDAAVPILVYASSVGTYAPGPDDAGVTEAWPTDGVATSFYSRHKAEVEAALAAGRAGTATRVVIMRPGLIFKRSAATEIHRLFMGRLLPMALFGPNRLPVSPHVDGLRFQVVHSHDVGAAYHEALSRDVEGAFNLATEPVIDTTLLAEVMGARPVPIPAPVLRSAVAASYHARLQPTPPGWLDMAVEGPIMDVTRARTELGWSPRWSAPDTVRDLLEGLAAGATAPTPPLRGDVYRHRTRPVALHPAPSA